MDYTSFDRLKFYVIIDRNTNLFLKKSARGKYSYKPNDFWTDKIGQARIFSSEAQANIGYNKDDKNADYVVVPYYAISLM